jgi:Flp pilus assembly protein TadG
MRFRLFPAKMRLFRKEQGGVAVEFAILLPVFLLLAFGIMDFGHAFYMQQMITSASREGARYATKYHTSAGGIQILPPNLDPTIPNYVIKTSAQNSNNGGVGLGSLLPSNASPAVSNDDLTSATKSPGYSSGSPSGLDIAVTVTATKRWWVIGSLIPSLGNSITLSSSTVMKCE